MFELELLELGDDVSVLDELEVMRATTTRPRPPAARELVAGPDRAAPARAELELAVV